MKTKSAHDLEVNEILKKFKKIQMEPSRDLSNQKKSMSNTMRKSLYRNYRKELGINKLNAVIEIDPVKMEVLVEPSCPMDQLNAACSKFNLIVPVMPEFKGITVGGAINGAAIESSSHIYGQFNDICISYEVLIGNGELIEVSKEKNPDLFNGIAGAYGSLGIITLVKLKLKPKMPYVILKYKRFESIMDGLEYLKDICSSQTPPEFIEGLIFDLKNMVIIEGNLTANDAELNCSKLYLKPFSNLYYQHVKETKNYSEFIETDEYLFRHDRGAFWMGVYALNYNLLLSYYLENRFHLKKLSSRLFGLANHERGVKLKTPGKFFRYIFGWWMSSRKLYSMLHADSENWFKERFIIQDYYIPYKNALKFINVSLNETDIFPLWLCPVRGTLDPQIFSPHYQAKTDKQKGLYIDIGIYGMPRGLIELKNLNIKLDKEAEKFQGRKMLYSFNYYTKDEFFSIYSKADYLHLRQKYHGNIWVDIFDKL
jgi:hypothetical protein